MFDVDNSLCATVAVMLVDQLAASFCGSLTVIIQTWVGKVSIVYVNQLLPKHARGHAFYAVQKCIQ